MELTTVWFILIAVLWIGYFTLEGFDFGVGMLLPVLAKDETERRVMVNTIGPVWDGNEVWVLVAGGATFAAFPEWYATLFSGFYLPLLLILVALIVRGLAFEYRHHRDEARWKARWDLALIVGSCRAGAAVGGRVRQHRARRAHRREQGVHRQPVHAAEPVRPARRAGHPHSLPHPRRDVHRAQDHRRHPAPGARPLGEGRAGAAVLAVVFLVWTQVDTGDVGSAVAFVVAALALVAGIAMARAGREGWAFAGRS